MGKERQSNIELLRLVAIFLIVMMHAAGSLIGTDYLPNRIELTAINAVGNMGVTVFMLISGFFGIHFRWSRLWTIWAMALCYSLLELCAGVWMSGCFSVEALYHALTPVTSRHWWFLTCYVVIFCLSPFLNRAVTGLTRRQMEWLLGVLLFFFVVSPTLLRNSLTDDMGGKGLPNLITAYLTGQYLRHYPLPERWVRHSGKWVLACVSLAFVLSLAAGSVKPQATILFCKDNNLLMVAGAIALFCWVCQHTFRSSLVNKLATYVFPLYLLNQTILWWFHSILGTHTYSGLFWGYYVAALAAVVASTLVVEWLRRRLLSKAIDAVARRIRVYDFQWDVANAGSHR